MMTHSISGDIVTNEGKVVLKRDIALILFLHFNSDLEVIQQVQKAHLAMDQVLDLYIYIYDKLFLNKLKRLMIFGLNTQMMPL